MILKFVILGAHIYGYYDNVASAHVSNNVYYCRFFKSKDLLSYIYSQIYLAIYDIHWGARI
ncbi:hypothetical protein KAM346_44160 [Aeromonas caviae]|nr:hypothetical protein KAM346_44160 [Aeromonas caviae]